MLHWNFWEPNNSHASQCLDHVPSVMAGGTQAFRYAYLKVGLATKRLWSGRVFFELLWSYGPQKRLIAIFKLTSARIL